MRWPLLIWVSVCALIVVVFVGLEGDAASDWATNVLRARRPDDAVAKTQAWIGASLDSTKIPQIAKAVYRRRPFAILYMPTCPVCQVDAADVDPRSTHLGRPIYCVTSVEEVREHYGKYFILDSGRGILPPSWYMGSSLLALVDEHGLITQIYEGKEDLERLLRHER